MAWTVSDGRGTYDVVRNRKDGKTVFSIVPHNLSSGYPSYGIGRLLRAVDDLAGRKYYWGIRYRDSSTGKLERARSKREYCNAFLDYILSGIGPILPFPRSRQWDGIVRSRIASDTDNIQERYAHFRKVSRKRRARRTKREAG